MSSVPTSRVLVAAVLCALALLGTFIYIVRQAADAGASRQLPPPKSAPVSKGEVNTITP